MDDKVPCAKCAEKDKYIAELERDNGFWKGEYQDAEDECDRLERALFALETRRS